MDVLSLFPPGSSLQSDGMLSVGGCRADELALEFGTPVRVVAEQALRDRAREYCFTMATTTTAPVASRSSSRWTAPPLVVRRETWADLLARDVE